MTNWNRRLARNAVLFAVAAALLAASDALASEHELVLLPDPKMLGILVVLFGALIVPANALIFRPIFRVLDERNEKIAGTRERANKLSARADAVLRSYEQSVREVRQDAESERKRSLDSTRADAGARMAEARAAAEAEIMRAREGVAAALAEARATLRTEAQDLAQQVAARVLGRALQ